MCAEQERETELWLEAKLFQNPINRRPDCYSAVEAGTGRRVAVKGPFETEAAAAVALAVNRLKRVVPGLDLLQLSVRAAVPNRWPAARLRFGFSLDVPRYFLLSEDLTAPHALRLREHAPTKWFPAGLAVVDFDALRRECGYKAAVDSESWEQPRAAKQLMMHILCDWVFGVGGDLANRNFVQPSADQVFNVDVDVLGRMQWALGRAQVCSARSRHQHFQTRLRTFDLAPLRAYLRAADWTLLPAASRAEAQRRAGLRRSELLQLAGARPAGADRASRRSPSPRQK